ncbi:MAG TPA: hypothetical protein ENJ95_09040 [Bacteroidetes bacterium]|nr:hypothetical protein [Bacteroidota bacterium]
MKKIAITLASFIVLFVWSLPVQAQYFGRNKPRYEDFGFKVLETPHFEIYNYLDNPRLLDELANQSEHWYALHQAALADTFTQKNPLILYNDHADFQQTNAIGGFIGIGTGGVTEGLKNRVVLPIAMSNAQTKHVLGHELVHAFQYHMIINGDSTSIRNLANIPLWMIEGLAEYMSIGRQDANTSLWMRDAVLHDKVPTLKDLDNPKYFPYRWGQAFWAFITGLKGDEIIKPLFVATAKYGLDAAIRQEVGMDKKALSELWAHAIKNHYGRFLENVDKEVPGKPLLSKTKNGGRINIGPALSPNGKYVAFLSEKGLFSIDLYIADAVTGEVVKNIHSATKNGHLDDLNFIESAGTWSPKSDRIAFVGVKKGSNVLVVKDLKGKLIESFEIPGLPAFSSPAWSPDGKSIVVAGLKNGQVDLYQVFLQNKKTVQLTNDKFSEMTPAWSADGKLLAFATDRLSMERGDDRWTFNLAVMDFGASQNGLPEVRQISVFAGADNLNPVFDNGGDLLFLSDRDGYRNMYQYEMATGKVFQKTKFATGISGITPYAPAISASQNGRRDRILFTHYSDGGYSIYRTKQEQLLDEEVPTDSVDFAAATLPKVDPAATDVIAVNLPKLNKLPKLPVAELVQKDYKPKFKLDYIGGGAGVGVGVNQAYGGTTTGVAGGIDMLFGDMLGNHQMFSSLYLNGEIYDFGGSLAYLNKKNRLFWGVGLSHLPYSSGRSGYAGLDTLPITNSPDAGFDHYVLDRIRTFEEKLNVFAQYPFSKTTRVEGGLSVAAYSNRVDRFDQYYDAIGQLVFQKREKVDAKDVGLNLFNGKLLAASFALVGDNSYFGIASPVKGYRYRLGVEKYAGDFDFLSLTADARKYAYLKPVTFAARAMHIGRYGTDANSFTDIFIGFPWYMRGYGFSDASELLQKNKRSVNELFGSKALLTNFEVRLPFTGPEGLSAIKSRFFFTELSLFVDGGLTWDTFGSNTDTYLREFDFNPLFSAGASLRINLFGALILEPYYAVPLLKETKGVFGLNIVPGW